MAVFTVVPARAFAAFAKQTYGFARVGGLAPISEGIENTNYKFVGDGKPYVFTVFELWRARRVDYYLALMRHFAACGLPVPAALPAAAAQWGGKPCAVVGFVKGAANMRPNEGACAQLGGVVAGLHLAAAAFARRQPNPRGGAWRRRAAARLMPKQTAARQELLAAALRQSANFAAAPLPAGACHCDLFRNNVLWRGGRVAAVIDFYFGGEEALLFDLAVAACDWCWNGEDFCPARLRALLAGYDERRRLTELEKRLFADALVVAALRFWVSRLFDWHFPRPASRLTPHDPRHFERVLRRAMANGDSMRQLLRRACA